METSFLSLPKPIGSNVGLDRVSIEADNAATNGLLDTFWFEQRYKSGPQWAPMFLDDLEYPGMQGTPFVLPPFGGF